MSPYRTGRIGAAALLIATSGCAAHAGASPAEAAVPAAPSPLADSDVRAQLAPSGRLRVAINTGNVVLAQPGGPRGATGPSVDIADELGRRLGVPVDLVVYAAAGDVVARLDRDKWDIGFMAIDPKRAEQIAFTGPYVFIDGTYMVREGSPARSVADLDREGSRIAVGQGAAYDLYLSRALKHAALVREASSPAAISAFENDPGIDAVAGVRQALEQERARKTGYRVLPDAFNRIEQAVAVPRGRDKGLAYVSALIEQLKADGFVRAALDRAGQRDAPVAPPARP
ncbi:transporter substrate-binding domain-containing protein [Novosphingobium resinovorum]|uniref:transporter substrate-binding domain-containing protein n=1 Tax=Novosphingobium resinovorum TaxID=158500 RepID=UPI002ED32110|nr:transporter substrate-binding domain-containing protein [Novosphingobium resinovorum]